MGSMLVNDIEAILPLRYNIASLNLPQRIQGTGRLGGDSFTAFPQLVLLLDSLSDLSQRSSFFTP